MLDQVRIADHTVWFKHITDQKLRACLESLKADEPVVLLADGIVGKWRRMRTGSDGRLVMGIRPDGAMKLIWNEWFETRRGEKIGLAVVSLADDYLASGAMLFSEWESPEDEAAFCDL